MGQQTLSKLTVSFFLVTDNAKTERVGDMGFSGQMNQKALEHGFGRPPMVMKA